MHRAVNFGRELRYHRARWHLHHPRVVERLHVPVLGDLHHRHQLRHGRGGGGLRGGLHVHQRHLEGELSLLKNN